MKANHDFCYSYELAASQKNVCIISVWTLEYMRSIGKKKVVSFYSDFLLKISCESTVTF